jgi:phycocyanobilin:ferredoxin oxidoreductase
MIWDRLIQNSETLIKKLDFYCKEYHEPGMERFNNDKWTNRTWKNDWIRRAHVDVVDVREEKGLWMQHVCVFPNTTNGGPIFGWDIIAGKKKVTGAFHDFSPLLKKEHPLVNLFGDKVKEFKPTKPRELPDWALKIFSPHMIAAGNITTEEEINNICFLVENNLSLYLDLIIDFDKDSEEKDVIEAQNYYCKHQQMNPHTPRVMQSLGLPEEDIKLFCSDNLFPIIK